MRQFPVAVIAAARAAMKATGIPASVTMAQWALESAWGTRVTGDFNYFGIKALPGQPCKIVPTHEYINGERVLVNAAFASYETMSEAFEAHARLLDGPRYAGARACLPDAKAFANALTGVYATDPNYGATLNLIMTEHNLTQYDR